MNKEYKFTIDLIKEAGEKLKDRYYSDFEVSYKNDDIKDIVTSIDIEINDFIIEKIKKEFLEHDIYSEESKGDNTQNSEYLWTIDPIDGTSNFSRHIPHFAICIGLLKNDIPVVGAVYNPITNELFSFEKGRGAFLNDKKIKVSEVTELKKSHVLLYIGRKDNLHEWGLNLYKKFLKNIRKTSNLSSSSLDICFVASGRVEAVVYGAINTLDVVGAVGILGETGGLIENGDTGEGVVFSKDPQKIFATNNPIIMEEIKKLDS